MSSIFLRYLTAAFMLGSSIGTAAAPIELPSNPILRLETGNHLSLITRVSLDEGGRYLVTSSEDKTIRVWSTASGQALAVLRPPVGEGSLGAIYASAISPDASTIAAGGNTAFDGENHALYLFDRVNATLREGGTLSGLEAPVQQLAWSADSELVAVGLRQQGLRVFDRKLRYRGGDEEYNDAVFGLAFSGDGRLAAASLDGFVRVYQSGPEGLQRIARKGLESPPYALAFSPDGQTLAVGYAELARVDLLDAGSLELIRTLDFEAKGNLGRIAWSADGRSLFAGGTASRKGRFPVLRFDVRAGGSPQEMASFDNIIVSLAATPAGGVAVGSAEPSWAILSAAGQEQLAQRRYAADFRDAGEHFRVAEDGHAVSFPLAPGSSERATFDIRSGELTPRADTALRPPVTTGRNLEIEGWHNGTHPQVNGQALPLLNGEVARSVAIAPDGRRFVMGTEWYLRAFDNAGRSLWEKRLPASAWAVNVSGDNRWALAALGDGTVRWYRLADGAEQMALFAHRDRERWVLWTPSGYYDTAVGGESLIGWHLNKAYNRQAQFYPVGRFRKHYYRPELLQAVLKRGDLAQALRDMENEDAARASKDAAVATPATPATPATAASLAPAAPAVANVLPPRVELRGERELTTTTPQIHARFAVFSPADAPVEEVKIRAGGRLAKTLDARALPKARGGDSIEMDVPVQLPPDNDGEITIIARNRNGLSEPATLRFEQQGAAPAGKTSAPQVHYKHLYVLAAGISAYPNLKPDFQLKYPSKDANDFVNVLKAKAAGLADQVEVRLLTDDKASKANILDALAWVRDKVGPEDLGVVFLAGHGFMLHDHYYFAGSDIDLASEEKGVQTALPGAAIQDTLTRLKGRGVFFLDTCHSGFALSELKIKSDMTGALNDMGDEHAVVILAGSAGRQSAAEADEWNNGAFTKAIVEGMNGKADYTRSGMVTPPLLHTYVSGRVRAMTEGQQTPKMVGAIFDEPIAVIRKPQ